MGSRQIDGRNRVRDLEGGLGKHASSGKYGNLTTTRSSWFLLTMKKRYP